MRRDPGTSPASTAGNTSAWVAAVRGITDNGEEGVAPLPAPVHVFQETSYRIPTPCDACQQQLRGHTRQGLKCKVCKVNIHHNCQGKVTLLQLQTQDDPPLCPGEDVCHQQEAAAEEPVLTGAEWQRLQRL